jgi:peptidoglycan/xylan/chitin deacetylase (PgdA/CDA1 family)
MDASSRRSRSGFIAPWVTPTLCGLVVAVSAACSSRAPHQSLSTTTTSSSSSTSSTAAGPVPDSAPVSPPGNASAAAAGVIDHGPRDRKAVALTFDSNLTASMTRELDRHQIVSFDNTEVIDELDRSRVPATFFLSGLWMQRYPATTLRLASDPLFELGSHSYAHVGFAPHCYHLGLLPLDAMTADVQHSEQVLASFTAHPTRYFRFPGGCQNRQALNAIASTGVTVIGYDVASGDAFGHSAPAIVNNVLRRTRNGSIIVMHITGGNTAPLTAAALPAIIDGLRARGFELVRLSQLLAV